MSQAASGSLNRYPDRTCGELEVVVKDFGAGGKPPCFQLGNTPNPVQGVNCPFIILDGHGIPSICSSSLEASLLIDKKKAAKPYKDLAALAARLTDYTIVILLYH
jgi:hypothetical protein